MAKYRALLIFGPNLNMLGIREKSIYGTTTYKELLKQIKNRYSHFKFRFRQYNSEEKIINLIHKSYDKFDLFLINGGALSHTSIAIMDALKLVKKTLFNIHLSDISKREDFRRIDYFSLVASKTFMGQGIGSYFEAIDNFLETSNAKTC